MYSFEQLKPEYASLWAACTINPGKEAQFKEAAALIQKGESIYKDLEAKTGVPWYLIGMLHYRESDCNFHTHLHNGDSLRMRTVHVPRGRPLNGTPPFTFEFSAIDALTYEGFTKIDDWSIERVLYCLEQYNGWGYRARGYPSAYVWAGTSNYHRGKFVSDGVFSPNVVDSQLGCAGILRELLGSGAVVAEVATVDTGTFKAKLDGATVDLKGQSRKWDLAEMQQRMSIMGGGLVAFLQMVRSNIEELNKFVNDYGLYVLIGVAVAVFVCAMLYKKYMTQDVQSGRAIPSGQVNA